MMKVSEYIYTLGLIFLPVSPYWRQVTYSYHVRNAHLIPTANAPTYQEISPELLVNVTTSAKLLCSERPPKTPQ